ncbi:MAG: J domain-containing protein [Desulfobacteraceae bacterium]|uniref:J domain-containing protein n=1 Tax=Candidatus Desulfaltia bathyphila TaxID=2841697 RepID=A0A8J6N9A0_9BACT|nr:J domain-containing protein [Candidatus Desulfaltia bathyphila]MBL7196361.1 J domain-containing protein [Desulfobacterales bacterium]
MYLALKTIKGKTRYFIRESYRDGACLRSRDLFDLGTDPTRYIIYPGGNAFYIDETVDDRLRSLSRNYSVDDLDEIFWRFLKPEIRAALEPYRHMGGISRKKRADKEKEEKARTEFHLFDKRRVHYLRFGYIDQGRIGRVSPKLFNKLKNKSRDELEQYFMDMERALDRSEFKAYIYVIFDLQKYFTELIAKSMPQGLNQNKVDQYFLEEICRLNSDSSFWSGMDTEGNLHEYLIRYVIMFFDSEYGRSSFLDDYIRDYMDSKRRYVPPRRSASVILDEASTIFGVKKDVLRKMSRQALTRLYRRMAQKLHPDKGGEKEKFVKLSEAYNELLKSKT